MSLGEADLQAYFDRIHFSGEARPNRETLAALVAAHTATIPFENLNPLLGLPVPLDPESLVAKLVRQRRGGYCYEQNGLFGHVLETIGLEFTPLAARVLWRQSEDALTPRTHKLLLVNLPEGQVRVSRLGANGEAEIDYQVTLEDGRGWVGKRSWLHSKRYHLQPHTQLSFLPSINYAYPNLSHILV